MFVKINSDKCVERLFNEHAVNKSAGISTGKSL